MILIDPTMANETYRGKNGCACGCGGTYAKPDTNAGMSRIAFINKKYNENPALVKVWNFTDEIMYEVENAERTRATRVYVKVSK